MEIKPFSDALEQLMNNQNLRAEMGKAGRIQMEQYAPQSIWNKWEELLVQVCNS